MTIQDMIDIHIRGGIAGGDIRGGIAGGGIAGGNAGGKD